MPVVNLQPGAIMNVAAGLIPGNAHVYRTGHGDHGQGNVGWKPDGGPLQMHAIAVGETVTFAINGLAGMIASGSPSMIQVLYH